MEITEIFFLAFNMLAIYLSMIWLVVYLSNRKNLFRVPVAKKIPSVTFLVPAFNEEKNIENCLNHLLNLDYPKNKMKIIVINDGSTDRTVEIVKKFKGVILLNKKIRGGKADALNYAIKFVDTDLIACMDADSFAAENYLKRIVGYFNDNGVSAITSAIKVKNLNTIYGKIQWVEYLVSIVFRKLFAVLDCQFVVPGAGGIYRTSVIKEIGGFDPKSLTEDMEIALRMQSRGYKIESSLDSYVYTECPTNFKGLFKQRMRWYRGYLENFKKYFYLFLNPKYGNLGMFFMPMTIVWIGGITIMILIQIWNYIYQASNSLMMWNLINNALTWPKISFDIFVFNIDSLVMSVTTTTIVVGLISLAIGLILSWIGIKSAGIEKIKRRRIFYAIYFIIYPILFSFFWLCAIIMDILRVRKKW